MSLHPPPKRLSWGDPQAIAILVAGVIGGIAVIIAALIGGDVINVSVPGPSTSSPAPTTPTTSTSPPPASETTTTPPDPTPIPTVRRTGKLVLSDGHPANLDSKAPDWDVLSEQSDDFDIRLSGYYGGAALQAAGNSYIAQVSGSPNYDTCLKETGFVEEIDPAKPDTKICVRTGDKRFAFVTVQKLFWDEGGGVEKIQLSVVVWEPQHE
jgi:hypothetical protein